MDDCIFCRIIKGEIPCRKIYEDGHVVAFLDVAGDAFGHTLVIPKEHHVNILDCPPDLLSNVMCAVRDISRHYVEDLSFAGVNVLCNCGEGAGQSVMHMHFHIFPKGEHGDCDLDEQCEMLKMHNK